MRDSIGRMQPIEPADREQLHRMSGAAFHKAGLILLNEDDLKRLHPLVAQSVINLAEAKHGKRRRS